MDMGIRVAICVAANRAGLDMGLADSTRKSGSPAVLPRREVHLSGLGNSTHCSHENDNGDG